MLNIVCVRHEFSESNSFRTQVGKIYLVIVSVCKFRHKVQSVLDGS